MQSCALQLHPDSPSHRVARIEVDVVRVSGGGLDLTYRVSGDLRNLLVAVAEPPARADDLWRHTCFEAFVSGAGGAYREFNFSPSGRWQAYAFSSYREGNLLAPAADPGIACRHESGTLSLRATIHAADLPHPPAMPLRLGLSAVIEAGDGSIAYWALRHPPGRPDFHHPDSFALELAPCV